MILLGYFWHISDFHLDTRYGNNTRGHDKEYFLGGYDEVVTIILLDIIAWFPRVAGQSREGCLVIITVTLPWL